MVLDQIDPWRVRQWTLAISVFAQRVCVSVTWHCSTATLACLSDTTIRIDISFAINISLLPFELLLLLLSMSFGVLGAGVVGVPNNITRR